MLGMKGLPYILSVGLMASLAAPAFQTNEASANAFLTCLGNSVELPILMAVEGEAPDERREYPNHQVCHAVCCKRDTKLEKAKKPAT